MEFYVRCESVSAGLRPIEATVEVRSSKGRPEFLRLTAGNLLEHDGAFYLAIGVVYVDEKQKLWLIEFPHEADSGANRIWVEEAKVLQFKEALR